MRYKCIYQTVEKLGLWAEELEDDIDFADYWHNLMLSKTKSKIDNFDDQINAFWVSRWKEDFEEFEDKYTPKEGEGYLDYEKEMVAIATQYLVYAYQISSRELAEFYGINLVTHIIENTGRYEFYEAEDVVRDIVKNLGVPHGVNPNYSFTYDEETCSE